jgi:steroid delta-isomerase-like uncharacterized protein
MDTRMTEQETVARAREQLEMYNSHHLDPAWLEKALAGIAADAEFTDVPTGRTFRGPEGYKRSILTFTQAYPGSRLEITNAFGTEDEVVIEYVGRGTHTGPLHLHSGHHLPATGRSPEVRFCNVYQFRHGKVVSVHSYYDLMTLLQQLGVAPL